MLGLCACHWYFCEWSDTGDVIMQVYSNTVLHSALLDLHVVLCTARYFAVKYSNEGLETR